MSKVLDFFQNNRKNLATFLYAGIVLISMICILTLFSLSRNISNQNSLSIEVLEIKRLSDEIDSLLTEGFSVVDQDVFNQKRNEITEILRSIENNNKYLDFFENSEASRAFTELKDAINAKKATLDEYLTQKAVITENLLDASSNLSRVKQINLFADYYTRLLLSRFGDIFDSESFADELRATRSQLATQRRQEAKNLLEDTNGTQINKGVIDYAFLQSLLNLNDNFQRSSETIERMKQLNISQKVDNFRNVISKYLATRSRYLDIILAILGLCVITYVGRLLYQKVRIMGLEVASKQFTHIIENTNINIIELDKEGVITSINNVENKNINSSIGEKLELLDENDKPINIMKDIVGKSSIRYDFTSRVSDESEVGILQGDAAEEIMDRYGVEESDKKRGKNLVYEKMYALPKLDLYGQLDGVNIVSQDFSGEYIANFRLNLLAESLEKTYRRDRETSLPNHIALISDLKKYPTAYLIYISIDQFQNVRFFNNSRVAHLILVEIGRVLYLCLKNSHAQAQLYHLQDDQFCVIFNSENNADAEKLTKQLINYFSNNISIKDEYQQTISLDIKLRIGISTPRDLENTDRLVQAKLAHQKAKQLDRQTFIYEQNGEIEISYRQNQVVSRMLRRALDTNKIITECQPIYNLNEPLEGENKYSLFSYEVLVRLLDEDGKIHYPGEFLNVAKNAGLYIALTKSIISIGFDLVERFDYRFSMNLACSDMSNDSVRELFLSKLEKCSAPDRVTVEVLESEDVEQNMVAVLDFIKEVRSKGCHVAIDDFGSGYANISMILQLNIDYIKIDGSIVQRLTKDEHAREFVRMLAGFTKSANYTMVAEFVSSQEILEVVKSLGVQYAQGFLLGKPTRLI